MRTGESYRLKAQILGIHVNGFHPRTTEMIPQHSIVTVIAGPLNGDRMIDVTWNGKTLMIFTQDLRERGEPVDGRTR